VHDPVAGKVDGPAHLAFKSRARMRGELTVKLGREPTVEEIASIL
jgi:hypothetical protein